jgi:hypothetical protein
MEENGSRKIDIGQLEEKTKEELLEIAKEMGISDSLANLKRSGWISTAMMVVQPQTTAARTALIPTLPTPNTAMEAPGLG